MRALWQYRRILTEVRFPVLFRFINFNFLSVSVSSQHFYSQIDCRIPQNRRTQRHKLSKLLLLYPPNNNPILYFKAIHAKIIVSGFEANIFLNNILISVYSKYGHWQCACYLFDRLSERNLITWSTMISVYAQHGLNKEALVVFFNFIRNGVENPNEFILATVIRCCTRLSNVPKGQQVHSMVMKSGFDQHAYVANSLLDFYTRVGDIESAKLLFGDLLLKDVVTWTTMILGFVKSGRGCAALQLFNDMMIANFVPDTYVISSVLAACSTLEFLRGGEQIHGYVFRREVEKDVFISNVLIDFYCKCGRVKTGRKVFDQMADKNVISWTTMISGYMQSSFHWYASNLFAEMNKLSFRPDGYACSSILTSCSSLGSLEQGRQVHAYSLKLNLESDEFVQNGLIDMYSKCSSLIDARRVFDSFTSTDITCYNAIIEGYSRHGMLDEALDLFGKMRLNVISPSLLTYVGLLNLSASTMELKLSKQIHALIVKSGFCLDIFAGSALIDVYSKCSFISDARLVFDEMDERDIVVWNTMIFGYVQESENEEAFGLYLMLQLSGMGPNEYTFVALLTACSNLASLIHGLQFHNQVIKIGLDFDPYIANALLDMYAKCGSIREARKLFDSTGIRDVACWNSMITTYAQHGEAQEALDVFEEMIKTGIEPNYISFVGVLSACSHVGLLEEGFRYFEQMSSIGIEPGTEDYACLVSLLGRSGKLKEAREFIEKMPRQPSSIVWRSLLSACRLTGNVEMAEHAAKMAIAIEPNDSGSYTLLSNIFASKGMWIDVKKLREKMDNSGVVKEAGCSWIEMNNKVHAFVARDESHNEAGLIYFVMDSLIQHMKGMETCLPISTD
ncbi:hypothetical protein M9H77_00885 [Catharanthus roseus]|uniref:Uncharacterized protein n=1 Tax=Catharanthus roseus TaxID=4058 RepID=A0ACC0C3Y4_CATRO|nr:hypothetical protein M9H77_00885 [Catharanthus roseus]